MGAVGMAREAPSSNGLGRFRESPWATLRHARGPDQILVLYRFLPTLTLAGLLVACGSSPATTSCDLADSPRCPDGARLKASVDTLAAPVLLGRRMGTPGNDEAASLVEEAFLSAGLQPAAGLPGLRQPFQAGLWSWTNPPALELGGAVKTLGADYELLDWSTGGDVSGSLSFAGYGLVLPTFDPAAFPSCPLPSGWDDFGLLDLTGRVAVVVSGLPGGAPLVAGSCPARAGCGALDQPACFTAADKVAQARSRGAVAVLLVPRSSAAAAPRPFASVLSTGPALWVTFPALAAALPDLAGWIAAVDTLGPAPVVTSVVARVATAGHSRTVTAANVIGVVPGHDPVLRHEVVVVGAHFDHLGQLPFRPAYFPGADDNASGTAVLMELARLVAASRLAPARTLVFAAWNGEELGLLGSQRWASAPPYPFAATAAAFSIDMVGAGQPGLQLAVAWEPGQELFTVAARSAAALGLTEPVTFLAEPVYDSDHYYFSAAGVPSAWVSTPTLELHPDYHTPRDTPDKVRPELLAAAARLAWGAIRPWALGIEGPLLVPAARSTTVQSPIPLTAVTRHALEMP
jgi:Peptidase family M28